MYIVVFTAELIEPDQHYFAMAEKLRKLAFDDYGCLGFEAVSEGTSEIAISRWDSLEDIRRWKQDPVHQSAQNLANKWYKNWKVSITEVKQEYSGNPETAVGINAHP
ncbi:MAG: antibiotic biosynthesis monooxygenase [Xanthomonadales bacterium]|nr:antibiotic biosynthesis monooxygenase [Xanthomonadales bacterium]